MPSVKKRFRGDQFFLAYPSANVNENSVQETVAGQTRVLGTELRYLLTATRADKVFCVFKTSSDLYFRGEEKFATKNKILPLELTFIKGKDQGLFAEIKALQDGKVWVDSYAVAERSPIKKDEEGGYMFKTIKSNPNFDAKKETRFGRGFRRVERLFDSKGAVAGFQFISFDDYTDEWASDIHGYDSFEDVLKSVYPLRQREKKALKEMYISRPRKLAGSSMILTPWQEKVITILDSPIKYDEQERYYHWFGDFKGRVGKSMLVKYIQATRDDTLVVSSTGKMSDLVYSVREQLLSNSRIKNIVFDLPRDLPSDKYMFISDVDFQIMDDAKHDGETLKFMESCVNGKFTSLKYVSENFSLDYGLKVIVFANSVPLITATSLDRWKINIIKDVDNLCIEDMTYSDSLPTIKTRNKVIDFYMAQPQFVEYLHSLGLRGRLKDEKSRHSGIP